MHIQSTKRLHSALREPSEVAAEVETGGSVSIDTSIIGRDEIELASKSAPSMDNDFADASVEIRIKDDLSDEVRLRYLSDIAKAQGLALERQADILKRSNVKPAEFSIGKTAGYTTIGISAGDGLGLMAQNLMEVGKNSNAPYLSPLCAGLGLLGAALGADQANGKFILSVASDAVKVVKQAVA